MDELNSEKNQLRGIFPDHKGETDSVPEPGQYYAIGSDNRINKQFDLILKSGDEYSFYYSGLLPFYRLRGNSSLTLYSYNLFIKIKGRNLRPLRDSLKKEKVIWIKESPSGKDDGETDTFISSISVEGEALNEE